MPKDLPPYPAYKDSGVPWLGEVPEHWQVSKVKNLARPGCKTFVDGDWIESPYITGEGIRLIQTGNIGVGAYREKGFRYISESTFDAFGCTEFQPHDVLICRLGQPVGRACLAPDLGVRMITSVDVCILKPREDVVSAFVVYAMSSHRYLGWVNSLVRGSTRDRVSRSMLGSFVVPIPSLLEQHAITRYLDHVDHRIRRAIRAKQKLIALLDEQKQAIIHQAVTHGLDPNVRLKPSGVAWLGEVPEHWEVTRLKALLMRPMRNGLFKKKEFFGSGAPLINVADIYRDNFQIDSALLERVQATPDEVRTFQVQSGDLFFVRSSLKLEGTGRSAVAVRCESDSVFECHLVQGRPDCRRVRSRFLAFQLNSFALRHYLISRANVVTMATVAQDILASCPVMLPLMSEQDRLLQLIDSECERADAAIDRASREIALLREYRTRLIADVVTGKVDVRAAALGLPEEVEEVEPLGEVEAPADDEEGIELTEEDEETGG